MLMKWLRFVLAGKTTKQTSLTARPTLEALEDRALPSMTVATPYGSLAQSLANTIRGNGITITGVSYTGANAAAGLFTNALSTIGVNSGIVLDTGSIANISGAYVSTTTPAGTALGTPGNSQLNKILTTGVSRDASVLTMTFVAQAPQITLSFVFATNEVSSAGAVGNNDTFAAFLNGTNVALPTQLGSGLQVNPTNVLSSDQFYENFPSMESSGVAPAAIKFNIYSTVLTLTANVTPGTSNTLNLVIADVGTGLLGNSTTDSAVFIQANSFEVGARPVVTLPASFAYNAATALYAGYLTVTNLGDQPMQGIATITFNSLPKGVTVANATGVNANGQYYITLSSKDLLPGQSEKIALQLSNPDHVNLSTLFNISMLTITL